MAAKGGLSSGISSIVRGVKLAGCRIPNIRQMLPTGLVGSYILIERDNGLLLEPLSLCGPVPLNMDLEEAAAGREASVPDLGKGSRENDVAVSHLNTLLPTRLSKFSICSDSLPED